MAPSFSFDPADEVIGLSEQWTGDLDGMIERRRIRALVPYSHTSYYVDGAERRGLAFEGLNLFEKALNEKLGKKRHVRVIFIPVTRDRLLPALLEGYGDIVAANMTITPQREEVVDFSEPFLTNAREVVVSGPAAPPLEDLGDLSGKKIHIRKTSSFYEHLSGINDSLQLIGMDPIQIELVEEHFENEEILEMVNAGLLSMTIVDEYIGNFWAQILDSIQVNPNLAIYSGGKIAWAIRKNSPQLKNLVDEFATKNKKGTLMANILFNRYLKNTKYVQNAFSPEDQKRFAATRDYFIKYGEQYNIDWLLLAAQGYQESRLNQNLVSQAGAVGIMQVRPSSAADHRINIKNVHTLDNNVHAGTKLLRVIMDDYYSGPEVDSLNAGLLALASYNAGPARIRGLRKKAATSGLDPNIWFDNVELIAAREIGRETVQYVSNIYKYYSSYRSLYHYDQQTRKLGLDN